jgi:nucleoside-diphosphate-sugar epimerase
MGSEEAREAAGEARPVLVTGATGFVGSHVVDRLVEAGYRVRCLVRKTSNLRWLEGKPVERHEADLRGGTGDLAGAVADVAAVIHCAGLTRGSSEALFAANHEGTRALLEACLRVGRPIRFVFCSSQAAAGPGRLDRPRDEGDPPAPTSDYGRSKLAAEREVLSRADRLEVSVVRPVAVYGPRDEDTLPYFRMAARGLVVAPGCRRRLVQLVHARDVADALVRAMERREAVGGTYFVGHPEILSWRGLAAAIGRAVGRRPLIVRLPSPLLGAAGTTAELFGGGRRPGQLDRRRARDLSERAWTCRVERAMRELGWSPTYDSENGLRATADWYREQGWL